jgi:Ice-binding-like
MKKIFLILPVVLLLAAACNSQQAVQNPAPEQTPAVTQSPPAQNLPQPEPFNMVKVVLNAQNNSGQSGFATIFDVAGKAKVILNIVGQPAKVVEPAHIHFGSCAQLGAVEYPLSNVGTGSSQTILSVSLVELVAQPFAINVHKSAAETGIYVACGDSLNMNKSVSSNPQSPEAVNLGTAGNFVILSKSGISTTGATKITGNIGVSPIAATAITGFNLALDSLGTFSTSALVTGKVYAANYKVPTPNMMTTAVSDMQTAYTNASGRVVDVTELGAGKIGGLTLKPGVYKWGTGVTIPTDVTLSGGVNDVWIFQIAKTLNISSGIKVNLIGGAQASNVFWQVAGTTTLGTNSTFYGNILDKTNIALQTGAILNGKALAQTAVTLQANIIK